MKTRYAFSLLDFFEFPIDSLQDDEDDDDEEDEEEDEDDEEEEAELVARGGLGLVFGRCSGPGQCKLPEHCSRSKKKCEVPGHKSKRDYYEEEVELVSRAAAAAGPCVAGKKCPPGLKCNSKNFCTKSGK